MKLMKIMLISTIVFSSLIFSGCQEKTKDVRKIAWNSLGNSEKSEVIGDWKDATVRIVKADKNKNRYVKGDNNTAYKIRFVLSDTAFKGKLVSMVTYRSTRSAFLGDIIKLVDKKSQKVVGVGIPE